MSRGNASPQQPLSSYEAPHNLLVGHDCPNHEPNVLRTQPGAAVAMAKPRTPSYDEQPASIIYPTPKPVIGHTPISHIEPRMPYPQQQQHTPSFRAAVAYCSHIPILTTTLLRPDIVTLATRHDPVALTVSPLRTGPTTSTMVT
ncbi:hypothetical protein BOTBODRAFT_182254 [Botryobasidium botryosum FD-172 SS1]|uniref:Uncharacterized protein n=1 Tax=Botryobasidium botryosum (strain FD-172 SS1) TaxID=930990 RepID=A0A067LU44_BOTB1|nr:hypothetical protein BOTBODRAFT_182254 [Botryobasidium botryosum FD-172 SS1]